MANIEVVYSKEFEPVENNEVVAWCGTAETDRCTIISIATGVVGPDGASYEVERLERPDGEVAHIPRVEGFSSQTGVTAFIGHGYSDVNPDAFRIHDYSDEIMMSFGKKHTHSGIVLTENASFFDGVTVEHGEWFVGGDAIFDGLRAAVIQRQLPWIVHDHLYYQLARASNNDHVIGDEQMKDKTETERNKIGKISQKLMELWADDDEMIDNLTIFGSLDAEDVPEVFAKKRRSARNLERTVVDIQSGSYLARLIPPVHNGRSWPGYMDVLADDEIGFGRELDGLEQDSVEPAKSSLESEMRALKARAGFADHLLEKLTKLSQKEQ